MPYQFKTDSTMIILMKRDRINTPVKIFFNWHKAGTWADNNIKADHQRYYFLKIKVFITRPVMAESAKEPILATEKF